MSSFWCLIKVLLTVSKFKTRGRILFSFQSLSIHVHLLSHVCIVLDIFYMFSRRWSLIGAGFKEEYSSLFSTWARTTFLIAFSVGVCLVIIWNPRGQRRCMRQNSGLRWKERWKDVVPLSMSVEMKCTSSSRVLIYQRTLYGLCCVEVKVARFNTDWEKVQ